MIATNDATWRNCGGAILAALIVKPMTAPPKAAAAPPLEPCGFVNCERPATTVCEILLPREDGRGYYSTGHGCCCDACKGRPGVLPTGELVQADRVREAEARQTQRSDK